MVFFFFSPYFILLINNFESIQSEYLIPDGSHKLELDWCIFFLNRNKAKPNQNKQEDKSSTNPFYYCLTVVCTKKDETVKRGAIINSITLITRTKHFHLFRVTFLKSRKHLFTLFFLQAITFSFSSNLSFKS